MLLFYKGYALYFSTLPSVQNLTWQDIGAIFAVVAIVGGGILWISDKIFNLGKISQRLSGVENAIRDDLKPGLQNIADKLHEVALAVNANAVTTSNSPRILNDDGKKILNSSGIKKIVEDRFNTIIDKVRASNPENSYQAEMQVLKAVNAIALEPNMKNALEQGAFESGSTVSTVLFVGGIHIRDRVLAELGLRAEDIDLHAPQP
jgi:hypothetical protein